jgi:hypothetical protein
MMSSTMLTAQRPQDNVVPLKNWATPLYWQANHAEGGAAAKRAPRFQLSANQVSINPLTFVAITPCRLVDTRGAAAGFTGEPPFSGPSLTSGMAQTFPVQSATEEFTSTPAPCGAISPLVQAYSLNVTVIPQSAGAVDYLTVWQTGAAQPLISTLNDTQGLIVANAAIVAAGTPSGGVSVYNSGPAIVDVIIDMNGFFTAPTDLNDNTAIGAGTLANNTTGGGNTAIGEVALFDNTTGSENTATGYAALLSNVSGVGNTASGSYALEHNTTGAGNSASGGSALQSNTAGNSNTASGAGALAGNTTGNSNTGSGYNALGSNTTGDDNIAIGFDAGQAAPGGNSNSIYIGSVGTGSDNSGTIQVGTQGTQMGGTYIAGIYGATAASGTEVFVTSNGQLGSVLSSGRFKEQITDMADSSSKLLQLRPVNFFYKPEYDDGSHLLQYGLIAEEVAKVYPEMVAYGNDGQVLTVKYQLLAPMLLNEVQKQTARIHSLEDRLAALESLLGNVPTTATAGQ